MIVALGLTVSKIDRVQLPEASGHNSQKCSVRLSTKLGCKYTKWLALAEICAVRMFLLF